MACVFLGLDEREAMRRKAEIHPWAAALVQRLKDFVSKDPFRSAAGGYETLEPERTVRVYARQARDCAILYCATGDDTYLPKMVDLICSAFGIDSGSSAAPGTAPSATTEESLVRGPISWDYGLFRGPFFYAYDLTRDHEIWQRDGAGEQLEAHLSKALVVAKESLSFARSSNNTRTWYAGTVAMLGGLLSDEDALALALEGPLSYKTMLGIMHDREMWPEPIGYAHHYVSCVLTVIAEVARHTGFGDLYNWQTSEGVSLKDMYDGLLHHAFANGRLASHGHCGGTTEMLAQTPPGEQNTTWCHPGDRLWGHRHNRNAGKFEIAYRVWKDPRYAWVLSRDPARDSWDHEFWGFSALTHGVELGECEPPDAGSRVWRSHGGMMLRGVETAEYWDDRTPAVYLRRGHGMGHGHSDSGHITLNAFGRNLYPDNDIRWDYQRRIDSDTGENRNPTPYSCRRIAHNTVSMNYGDSGECALCQFSSIQHSGPMKVGRFWGKEPPLRRIIGVTPDYVLDWCSAGRCVGVDPHTEHIFDYHIHGMGLPRLDGVTGLKEYATLSEEYGLGPIDTQSDSPENIWIRPGVAGEADGEWTAVIREDCPLDQDAVRGVFLHVFACPGTRVITGNVPDYVSMKGWDATYVGQPSPARLGLLVIRRQAVSTEFVVIHQAFCGDRPPLKAVLNGRSLSVSGEGFVDHIDMQSLTCIRNMR